MNYTVRQATQERKPFEPYWYNVLCGDRLVAKYWHDHRGDEHGLVFTDGTEEDSPVGQMTDFLKGGGPLPLALSDEAQAYLRKKLAGNRKQ